MSRQVQLVLICEDRQHETFARRFLEKAGWSTRRLRVEMAPAGRGSGEQFVRENFPRELAAFRSRSKNVDQRLIVILDGDRVGTVGRLKQLDQACQQEGIDPRLPAERVLVAVPTWNIETWLAYLAGHTVDEGRSDYPRLERPRDCQSHVETLWSMCQQGKLRQPAPASLVAVCQEYRSRFP